jgi:hypothetical protein
MLYKEHQRYMTDGSKDYIIVFLIVVIVRILFF